MNDNVQEAIEWFRFSKVKFEREFEAVKNSKSDYRHDALVNTIKTLNLAIQALQAYQPWNGTSYPPSKNGKYLLYAPKFIYEGCEYSETLDIGLYHDGLGFSMPNCFPEPKATHWLEIRKPYEVEL